ncbi:MAG: sulfatase/phosphatase domain-containing protein, partial [Coraliomargarita sp.]
PTNNFPLRSGKGNNYEGGVRIPLIVRWPGVTEPGSVNHSVVSTVDHYPAILEMTGQALRPDTHKDGVSYVPALKGEAFDRGPTICDMARYVYSTQNLPNTFVRDGDWKLFRFWHDNPKDLTHRYELYNLKDDIGENVNLAEQHPEKLKELSDILDDYYAESKVLSYHPNQAYNNRTVGTWFATSDEGTIAARDGSLVLKSENAGYTVANNYFSPDGRNMRVAFEARSATETPISFAGPKRSTVVELTKEWKPYELSTPQIFIQRNKFFVSLEKAGEVELRNVKVLTTDRSVMAEFKFY